MPSIALFCQVITATFPHLIGDTSEYSYVGTHDVLHISKERDSNNCLHNTIFGPWQMFNLQIYDRVFVFAAPQFCANLTYIF